MKFMISALAVIATTEAQRYNENTGINLMGPDEGCDSEMPDGGCGSGETGDAAVAECETTCNADPQCIGFVTHRWGANMKSSVPRNDCLIQRWGFNWYQKSDYTIGDPKRSADYVAASTASTTPNADEVLVEDDMYAEFFCNHKNCMQWDCIEWCKCYNSEFDAIYDNSGCSEGEDTCKCP